MTLEPEHLNWIDYTIIGVIAFSTLMSFFRGFIREAISLIAWTLGLVVSLKYAMVFQIYLSPWIDSEAVRYFSAFVILFLVIVLAGLLMNMLVHTLLDKTALSILDRFIGIFFGVLRGCAIVALMLLMLTHLGTVTDSMALRQSMLAQAFKPTVLWLNRFLPDKMKFLSEWLKDDFHSHRAVG